MTNANAALAARVRVRERAEAQRRALRDVLAADDGVRRAEQRRAELVERGDRIVHDARTRHASTLGVLVDACGSVPVAADLLGTTVTQLRRQIRLTKEPHDTNAARAERAQRSDT